MDNNLIGMEAIVYDRYLFAVPVRGYIASISDHDGAYQISFYTDNSGGPNVVKHDGTYFHPEQCRVTEPKERANLGLATTAELIAEITARIEVSELLNYKTTK